MVRLYRMMSADALQAEIVPHGIGRARSGGWGREMLDDRVEDGQA